MRDQSLNSLSHDMCSSSYIVGTYYREKYLEMNSSAESKKGINAVQRCSIENQKGVIATLRTAIVPFWFSMEHG